MDVLIAEDNVDTANIYRVALKSRGHNVTITLDGLECLQVYKNMANNAMVENKEDYLTPYDAVVLDYRMSDLDGLETAKAILQINPKQRIIFASAYVRATLRDSVKNLHQVVELIEKPFEPKTLVELVENTYVSRELAEINSIIMDMDVEQATISGQDVLKGLRRMSGIFGVAILNVLIREVQNLGIDFKEQKRYSAGDLQSLLKSVIGDHAGIFLMRFFIGYFARMPVNNGSTTPH